MQPVQNAAGQSVREGMARTSVDLHFVETGVPGRTILLVHGIGMDWRVWQATMRRLSPNFHVLAIDLRGHGGSEKPAQGYTLADYAADLEEFVEKLKLTDVTLIGSSLGGAVCAAVEAPVDIVSRRILVDPPLNGGPVPDPTMFVDILQLKHLGGDALERYLSERNPRAGRHLTRAMSEMWRHAADGVVVEMLAREQSYYDLSKYLKNIESPTLLVQADPALDAVLTDDGIRDALLQLPHGYATRVSGAGHAVHAFKPVEFISLVEQFIDSGRL